MKKKRERDWLPVTVLLLTVLLLVLCLVGFDHHEPDGPDGNGKAAESELSADELQVTFFDVGKSDAILVEQSGYRMLIDTSFDDQADVLLNYFADHGIDTLDYLIITHFDKDHVGGADKILDAMHVKRVMEPDYTVEKKQFREYREALIRNRITAMRITDVERRSLGRASFIIYPPEEKDYDGNDNDLSLVLSLRYGTQSFLFTGDSEQERLTELMERTDLNLHHTVLKMPHHGIKEKNTIAFLEAVRPVAAVVTCRNEWWISGKIKRTLNWLGTDVYLTSNGNVVCLTDGNHVEFKQG